uniref:WD domain-containing protein, G-beta repeat-containing protein n=1 Tax=Candidatus Kentrum sp. TUN TaxID=2126343 RepID=A0A451AD38_9GAMM|nr:MAG: WD domain-containing protein, G-beta repeat-containing protein [Candidatus Kentron sp. TUN]
MKWFKKLQELWEQSTNGVPTQGVRKPAQEELEQPAEGTAQQMAQQTTDSPHPALKLRHTLRGHTSNVHRMALSPDGRTLASPSVDKTVRLWDAASGRGLQELKGHSDWVTGIALVAGRQAALLRFLRRYHQAMECSDGRDPNARRA